MSSLADTEPELVDAIWRDVPDFRESYEVAEVVMEDERNGARYRLASEK